MERVVVEWMTERIGWEAGADGVLTHGGSLANLTCVTSTGLHDDLEAAGGFCREHGIWLHVDAAHGAPALLSPTHRPLLRGSSTPTR